MGVFVEGTVYEGAFVVLEKRSGQFDVFGDDHTGRMSARCCNS